MNDLQIFENPEFGQVRTVEINGTPWLVGKDVATALEYKNPSKAILTHVDDEDKRLEILPQSADSQNGNVPGASKTALINESGLYSLILSSKMPKAKAFKRWAEQRWDKRQPERLAHIRKKKEDKSHEKAKKPLPEAGPPHRGRRV